MLFRDPPHHTRLRDTVSRAFTPRAVEVHRPRVQSHVDVLLKRVAAADRMDVVADLAEPLSRAIIGDLLGIPEAHRPPCAAWSAGIARSLDALPVPEGRPLVAEGEAARLAVGGYIRWCAARWRNQSRSRSRASRPTDC
jgi:cytochrome P450